MHTYTHTRFQVSAEKVVGNAYAKPLIVKSRGLLTATFELAFDDLDTRRALEEMKGNRKLSSDDTIEVEVSSQTLANITWPPRSVISQ